MLTRVELRIAVGAGCWQAELSMNSNRKLLEGKLGACPATAGSVEGATPERLTLTAMLEGLRAITRPCDVRLHARPPSGYSNDDFDCWDALIALTKTHRVEWEPALSLPKGAFRRARRHLRMVPEPRRLVAAPRRMGRRLVLRLRSG